MDSESQVKTPKGYGDSVNDVVAVVPTLGVNIERLNAAIASLRKFPTEYSLRIVVINNSKNPELSGVLEADEILFPGINLGYVGALEFAHRKFNATYLWSIQDDMTLSNDVLTELIAEMDANPTLAIASPVLVRDGLIPAGTRAGVFSNSEHTQWTNLPEVDIAPENFVNRKDYSFVSASGALFRQSALSKVGGFNLALYPLKLVDVDICARFLQHKFDLALVSRAHIEHEIEGSTPKLLRQVLDKANAPLIRELLEHNERTSEERLLIDADIVYQIAQKASRVMMDLSQEGDGQIIHLRSEVQRLKTILQKKRNLQDKKRILEEENAQLKLELARRNDSLSRKLLRQFRK